MYTSIKTVYLSTWLGSLFWLLSNFLAACAAENNLYDIELKFKHTGIQRLVLSVCVSSKSEIPEILEYVLIIKKERYTIIKQKGNLFIKPEGKRCDFSKVMATAMEGETLSARISLYKQGNLLAEASTSYRRSI